MEAAPKFPMLSFELKTCTENVQFGPQLKKYISTFYGEDPDSYLTEINNLESLRLTAVRPTMDVNGVQLLKKYYCQLHFLKSRFPMEENQDASVQFAWKNNQLDLNYASNDIGFELAVIMYNIGALHSYLGANDLRTNPEGMKMSCTHFQCAAWAFQTVKEKYFQFVTYISLIELVHFFQHVCLAQAQECILEKSMLDNRKPTIIAKVAVQVYSYYKQSLRILESVSEDNFRDKAYKEWTKYLQFKLAYYRCIAMLFQGEEAEEQQKMGERVAYYQAASEQLEKAKKYAALLTNQVQQQEINEGLAFTQDVVEGKRKAAKNENEFIYHEAVPDKDQLQEVKGASLVKGIPFSINDVEVSGPDIFSRLVPMEAHEAASLYSEKKAQILRQIGELIEKKDQNLAEFMSSMQLDLLTKMHQATGIPQELIDRAAALSAKPNAVQDLINSMGKLSNIYQDVEANLNEIDALLKAEEEAEKEYQEKIGKRPPSILATDLAREAAKYREAHTKANDSNQTLHRAMTAHVANLKILQQPLKQLQLQLPFVEFPNQNIDEKCLKDLEALVGKVEEMRNQRVMLWAQLREALHKDDITSSLVTKQPNQSLEQLFKKALDKHQKLIFVVQQNTAAQENIKEALVDSYALAVNTRKYIQDILQKRSTTISSLISSYDSYDDLLAKANKGIEFYTKLETNVSKLLQRIKSTCKVQQEEREQVLSSAEAPKWEAPVTPATPKLKDYLDSRKKNPIDPNVPYQQPPMNYATNVNYPPGVRPTPVGSEVTDVPKTGSKDLQGYIGYNFPHQSVVGSTESYNASEEFIKKMLMSNSNYPQYAFNYTSYTPQNYPQSSYHPSTQTYSSGGHETSSPYDPEKAFTTTINSYSSSQSSASSGYSHRDTNTTSSATCNAPATNTVTAPPSSTVGYSSIYQYQNVSEAAPIVGGTNYPQGYTSTSNLSNASTAQYKYYSTQPSTGDGNSIYSSAFSNIPSINTSNASIPNFATGSAYDYYYSSNQSGGTSVAVDAMNAGHQFTSNQINQPSYNTNTSYYPAGSYPTNSQGPTAQAYPTGSTSYSQVNQTEYPNTQATPGAYNTNQNASGIVNQNYSQYYMSSAASVPSQQSSSGTVLPVQTTVPQSTTNYEYSYYGTTYPVPSNQDPHPNYSYNVTEQAKPSQPQLTVNSTPATKSSNIDLLSGLDFNINQAPLVPQQNIVKKTKEIESKPTAATSDANPHNTKTSTTNSRQKNVKQLSLKILPSKPLNNKDVKHLFHQELERYEKFVESLTNKTLSGPTLLDIKWKEIQDQQDNDLQKKIISVARCYPMKNRFPDILPYDYSRVELCDSKDDYINASYVKDVSPYAPAFIVTQLPLSSTFGDFWTMIREQQVELILCLQNDNEIGGDIYWPREKGQSLNILNMVVATQSIIVKSHWIERLISVNLPEKRESRVVLHLQFTSWPGSLFPTSPEDFISYVIESINLYQQQKCNIHPVVLHCSSGIGRSGLICLLTAAIFDVTNNSNSLPDLTALSIKLSNCRKNLLRDREHLKFGFECFLAYIKNTVSEDKLRKKLNELDPIIKEEVESVIAVPELNIDPLSTLDPFWASKR